MHGLQILSHSVYGLFALFMASFLVQIHIISLYVFHYYYFYFYCLGRVTVENTGVIYARECFACVLFEEF